jgi:hypothetical protein
MVESENKDVIIALDEMRLQMAYILQAGDALDQKINTTLSAAGLIIAITSTLQISLSPNASNLYWFFLISALIIYSILVIGALIGMKPQRYRLAIAADWKELDKRLFNEKERDAILALLAGYVDQINYNSKLNMEKVKIFKRNILLLGVVVIVLILLVPISLI